MLTVKFFSLIRERLGVSELMLDWQPSLATVDAVKRHLADVHGDEWQAVLFQPNVVQAVNQKVVFPDNPVAQGDELAFFPPMTGG